MELQNVPTRRHDRQSSEPSFLRSVFRSSGFSRACKEGTSFAMVSAAKWLDTDDEDRGEEVLRWGFDARFSTPEIPS